MMNIDVKLTSQSRKSSLYKNLVYPPFEREMSLEDVEQEPPIKNEPIQNSKSNTKQEIFEFKVNRVTTPKTPKTPVGGGEIKDKKLGALLSDQKRRLILRGGFDELENCIPCQPGKKYSKAQILNRSKYFFLFFSFFFIFFLFFFVFVFVFFFVFISLLMNLFSFILF